MRIADLGAAFKPAVSPEATAARDRAISMLAGSPPPAVTQPSESAGQNHLSEDSVKTQSNEQEQSAVETSSEASQSAAEVPPQETQEERALSTQYAALARREKQIRAQSLKQEQSFKAREQELINREQALLRPQEPKIDVSQYIPRDLLKSNALQALAEAGVSYEELTQQILNQGPVDPRMDARAQALETKIQKLEQALESQAKAAEEAQGEQYKTAMRQLESDAKRLAYTDPNFEMIKATNSVKDVVQLIEMTWKEKGEMLSIEEASQQVEDYLVNEAERLSKIEKIRKRLQPTVSKSEVVPQVQKPGVAAQQTQPQMKTLTNSNSVQRKLTSRERAIAAFKGELK